MAYAYTPELRFPLAVHRISRGFLKDCSYRDSNNKWVHWGLHLGEDYNTKPGVAVYALGKGKVVYSALHPGLGPAKRNWGNIIIIAHKNLATKKVFFSLYGHLGKKLVNKKDKVTIGQKIGTIAAANTKENGWWDDAHLHFAIYRGLWKGKVLPGYYKAGQHRTRVKDWVSPHEFVRQYHKSSLR